MNTTQEPVAERPFTLRLFSRHAPVSKPDWAKEFVHPELEKVGPDSYRLDSLLPFRLPEQDGSGMRAQDLYEFLKSHGQLRYCLSLADAAELEKHPKEFHKQFGGLYLILWKSLLKEWGDEDLDDDEENNWGEGGTHVPILLYDAKTRKVKLSRIEISEALVDWNYISPMLPAESCR